ncbi:hypothetical protein, partial [Rhodococcus sp. A14]|uniref:hypothetical protein n=1 Tax=Rhodococcus sp. A14 TaxID=1194106 RepID=UPI00197FCD99
ELRDGGVGNYVTDKPLNLGNYMTADIWRSSSATRARPRPPIRPVLAYLDEVTAVAEAGCVPSLLELESYRPLVG